MQNAHISVFAYGALLNLKSFERMIGRPYTLPLLIATLRAWRRSWDCAMPNEGFYEDSLAGRMMPQRITYLNVRPSADAELNGVVYQISERDLELIDSREEGYSRVNVMWAARDGTEAGEAFMYVANPEWALSPGQPKTWAAIRKTYLDAVAEGVNSLGDIFRTEYARSTDAVPPELVLNDKIAPGVFEI